jgi:predicted PurR-regulated permease PerM
MISTSRIERIAGLALLSLLAVGSLVVLRPFMSALLWAVILTFSTWPIYAWLLRKLGGRVRLAAAVMTLAVAAVLVAPLAVLGATLAEHVAGVADIARTLLGEGLPEPPAWVAGVPLFGPEMQTWASFAHDQRRSPPRSNHIAKRDWRQQRASRVGASNRRRAQRPFFFRDGVSAAAKLHSSMHRLAGSRAQYLLEVAGNTVKGVVYGVLGTAAAQAALAGLGLWIAGVPGALLLGFLTLVLSLIPFGPPLVWVPATAWLFYSGDVGWGIFMALWGFFVVSGIYNVLKPYLISRESRLPILLVFLGVIGGVIRLRRRRGLSRADASRGRLHAAPRVDLARRPAAAGRRTGGCLTCREPR